VRVYFNGSIKTVWWVIKDMLMVCAIFFIFFYFLVKIVVPDLLAFRLVEFFRLILDFLRSRPPTK